MRKLLQIIAGIILFSFTASAQPKGATTIIVKGVDYKMVTDAIMDNGYFIENNNPDLGTATTMERSYGNGVWLLIIQARVKDSTAYITGKIKVMLGPFGPPELLSWDPVENKGMKKSPLKLAFAELVKVALSLNKPMEYK